MWLERHKYTIGFMLEAKSTGPLGELDIKNREEPRKTCAVRTWFMIGGSTY